MATKYVLTHNGAEVDSAVGRALAGGAIDLDLSVKADKAPPAEQVLLLASGFSGSGSVFRKYQDGLILVNFNASGSIPTGATIATLPSGYRPIRDTLFSVMGYSISQAQYVLMQATITTAGIIVLFHTNSANPDTACGALMFQADN